MTLEAAASILADKFGGTWNYWFHYLEMHPATNLSDRTIPAHIILYA